MIEPVVFPFTTISSEQVEAIGPCCQRLGLYLPSDLDIPIHLKQLADAGRLALHLPVIGDTDRLKAVLADYRAWAALHGPGALAQFKAFDAIPLWDPESTPDLVGALGGKAAQPVPPLSEGLFKARVFLHLAQELDRRQDELGRDMAGLAAKEQALYAMLRGDGQADHDVAPAPVPDAGATLTALRLQAWAKLVLAGTHLPGLMITTSQAVWEHLMETYPQTCIVARFSPMPEPSCLDEWIAGLASGSTGEAVARDVPPQPAGEHPALILARIGDWSCRHFLADLAGGDVPAATPIQTVPALVALAG